MAYFIVPELERYDAPLSVFFARQLEVIRPQPFEIIYPNLRGRQLVPIKSDIDPGAELYTYYIYDEVGKARIVRDYAKDFPRVDIFGRFAQQKIESIGDSYGWSVQELRNAAMAGFNLSARKANAARRAIERLIDESLLIGDAEVGMTGLFTQPITGPNAVTVYTIEAGASTDTEWETKTDEEILADLHGISAAAFTATNGVQAANTLVVPLSLWSILTVKRDSIQGNTLLAIFLANDPHISSVEWSERLETAGVGPSRRIVAYWKDAEALEGLIPQEFEQFPPEWEAMTVKTHCHARIGGVAVYYPKLIVYGDGA